MARTPSYMTKTKNGLFVFQVRIPRSRTIFQRSLSTRDKKAALRKARRWIVLMEDTEFDIDAFDRQCEEDSRLYHIGLPLFQEMNRLHDLGDTYAVHQFIATLTSEQETALRYVAGQNATREPATAPTPVATVSAARKYSDAEDPTLDLLYEEWLEEDWKHIPAKTSRDEYQRMAELFLQVIKELNGGRYPRASEIDNDLIRRYKSTFEKIPLRVHTKGRTIKQLLSAQGKEKSPSTIKQNFGMVGRFVMWIRASGYPLDKQTHEVLTYYRAVRNNEKMKRVPWDDEDLQKMFHSEQYRQGKWKRGSEFWVPLIALFTGMTRNEIVQLHKNDIYKDSGVHVIDINEDGDKRLKVSDNPDAAEEGTTGRPRIVPIHPQLVALGFLKFVDWTRGPRLFPEEKRDSRGQFGPFGKRNRNYRIKVGAMPRSDMEYRDFHSFRHLMKTKLGDVEKNHGIIDDILGHTSKDRSKMTEYDHSKKIKFKSSALKKVKFDCIDFDLIAPWGHNKFAK